MGGGEMTGALTWHNMSNEMYMNPPTIVIFRLDSFTTLIEHIYREIILLSW